MHSPRLTSLIVPAAVLLLVASPAKAQDGPSPATPGSAPPPASAAVTDAQPPAQAQIDETIVNLPTTLPLKAHGSYFRLTHRFARDLRRGSFGDLTQDLFSLDNGAEIGLEYRYGITSRLQAGVHRTIFNKTIVTFGRWDALAQSDHRPFGLSIGASFEGSNNLRIDHQPGLSATVSHTHGGWLALYATPAYVIHAHTTTLLALHEGHQHDIPGGDTEDDNPARNTSYLGLGARVRFRPTAYLVVEASPRLSGYTPDRAAWNVGVEKTTRGHVLQLNFGNNFSTTPGQIARGGDRHDVFLGFNISRRFY